MKFPFDYLLPNKLQSRTKWKSHLDSTETRFNETLKLGWIQLAVRLFPIRTKNIDKGNNFKAVFIVQFLVIHEWAQTLVCLVSSKDAVRNEANKKNKTTTKNTENWMSLVELVMNSSECYSVIWNMDSLRLFFVYHL